MIPENTLTDVEFIEYGNTTYNMDIDNLRIIGISDNAIKQMIYKILNTERYQYLIYSWNYGVEFSDLFGEPIDWVCAELRRRITEALIIDNRIISVDDFEFDTSKRSVIFCTFTVYTNLGEIAVEKVVNI